MKCPICQDTKLVLSDRQDVEIDHCPRCGGVWLDRGELDQLIERSATPPSNPVRHHAARSRRDFVDPDYEGAQGHDALRSKHKRSAIYE
jgi:Zn-finger nucleic acid-binding protein